MTRETFRDDYPPGNYWVGGDLLNAMARHANAQASGIGSSSGNYGRNGVAAANVPPPHSLFALAIVTNTEDECERDYDAGDANDAPCPDEDKYLCRLRWFDHTNQRWAEYDEDVRLDASGYWEGDQQGNDITTPTVNGVTQYPTDASADPASGPGYGQIPQFLVGDIVPVWWDAQRGWAVPIVSPYDATPRAEFVSEIDELIPVTQDEIGTAVHVYIEVRSPETGQWRIHDRLAWRVPGMDEGDWYDSRAGFATFEAPSQRETPTYVRFRFVTTLDDYDLYVSRSTVEFLGMSRKSKGAAHYGAQTSGWTGGDLRTGWSINASAPGRFADSPTFEYIGSGTFRVNYADLQDNWIAGVRYQFEIANIPDSSSSSSSSSSSETPDTSTTTSQPQLPPTTDYCCCTVVTDVECDEQGHVKNVCYSTLCFPKIPGVDCVTHCGTEICVPCGLGSSTYSQTTSTSISLTSVSSTTLTSTSASSTTLSSLSSNSSSSCSTDVTSQSSESSTSMTSTLSGVTETSLSSMSSLSSTSGGGGIGESSMFVP